MPHFCLNSRYRNFLLDISLSLSLSLSHTHTHTHTHIIFEYHEASLVSQMVNSLPVMQETLGSIPVSGIPLEKGITTHSSILAWRIPWAEEPRGLQSMGPHRVRHD